MKSSIKERTKQIVFFSSVTMIRIAKNVLNNSTSPDDLNILDNSKEIALKMSEVIEKTRNELVDHAKNVFEVYDKEFINDDEYTKFRKELKEKSTKKIEELTQRNGALWFKSK